MNAVSPAEWASSGFAGLSAVSLIALAMAFVDADLAYFDPRPAVRCSAESGRLLPVWQGAVHTRHDLDWAIASGQHYAREFVTDVRSYARLSLRDTAFTATALYALLTINPGATR